MAKLFYSFTSKELLNDFITHIKNKFYKQTDICYDTSCENGFIVGVFSEIPVAVCTGDFSHGDKNKTTRETEDACLKKFANLYTSKPVQTTKNLARNGTDLNGIITKSFYFEDFVCTVSTKDAFIETILLL